MKTSSNIRKKIGQLTITGYLIGLILPFKIDISLYILSTGSLFVLLFDGSSDNKYDKGGISLILKVIFVFIALMCISIIASENILHSLFSSFLFLPSILFFFLILKSFQSEKDIFKLYFLLSLFSLVICVLLLIEGATIGMDSSFNWIDQFENPFLVVPNDSIFFSVVAPMSTVILIKESYCKKTLSFISLSLGIISVILLKSRGAFLIMFFSFLFVFLNHFKLKNALLCITSLILLTITVDCINNFELTGKFFFNGQESRISLWIAAWALFLDHPLFGYGPHMFVFHYLDYLPTDGRYKLGDRITPWAHNLYLELLAEQGLLVMFCFITLLLISLYKTCNIIKKDSNNDKSLAGLGAAASLASFALAAGIELSFLRIWVVLIFFILLAVIHNLSAHYQEINT